MNGDKHLTQTFTQAEKLHPELMEPYSVMLVDAGDAAERIAIMRRGLRETVRARYPMPEGFDAALDRAALPKVVVPA